VLPSLNAALLEIAHEVPQRGPDHVVREARIPGDVDAEREMLLEREITRELAAHEGERTLDRGARAADLVLAVGRLELHPVDAAVAGIAVEDHRKIHGARDPMADLHAFAHRRRADISQSRIAADDGGGADEARLAARLLHDARERRGRRMQHREHAILAREKL